ncbi:MAG: hypothetical protein Q9216_005431 [Gyalolechia sp. 2 TL-2023]
MADIWSRRLPHSVRTVDLLGSWDNFHQVYPLQRDRQAGPGHWRGCHSFKNITCEGHDLNPSVSRDGGLRMGGTYWYYYRLNGELEQHDPLEPFTTACPLLPGQQVNVLEVPIQIQHETGSDLCSRRLLDSTVFTLDPSAKFSSPKPSLHRKITQEPVRGLPNAPAQQLSRLPASSKKSPPLERTRLEINQRPHTTCPKTSFLMTIFRKLRGTRSAPSTSKISVAEGSKPRTMSGKMLRERQHMASAHDETFVDLLSGRLRAPVNTPEWPSAITQTHPVSPWTSDSSIELSDANQSSLSTASSYPRPLSTQTAVHSTLSEPGFDYSKANVPDVPEVRQLARGSVVPTHDNPPDRSWYIPEPATTRAQLAPTDTTDSTKMSQANTMTAEHNCLKAVQHAASPLVLPIQSNALGQEASIDGIAPAANRTRLRQQTRPPSLLLDNRDTLSTYYDATSSLGSQSSPHCLSRPDSPSLRDFEEASESGSPAGPASLGSRCEYSSSSLADQVADGDSAGMLHIAQFPSSGFQGYSIPGSEHASSSLTLRKPASATFSPNRELSSNDQLVRSWNDGSAHGLPVTVLDELVGDDLGYLGKMIV